MVQKSQKLLHSLLDEIIIRDGCPSCSNIQWIITETRKVGVCGPMPPSLQQTVPVQFYKYFPRYFHTSTQSPTQLIVFTTPQLT